MQTREPANRISYQLHVSWNFDGKVCMLVMLRCSVPTCRHWIASMTAKERVLPHPQKQHSEHVSAATHGLTLVARQQQPLTLSSIGSQGGKKNAQCIRTGCYALCCGMQKHNMKACTLNSSGGLSTGSCTLHTDCAQPTTFRQLT